LENFLGRGFLLYGVGKEDFYLGFVKVFKRSHGVYVSVEGFS